MKFNRDGEPLSDDGFEHARDVLDIDEPTLWALLSVETGGFGFLPSRRPVILFERHVFSRLTDGRFDLEHPGLSNPVPGGYMGGPAEYARLNGASQLDSDAALQSTSWGIGQVMGCHWEQLGYRNVEQMAAMMSEDEDDQLIAAARFIDDEALNDYLQERDWTAFANGYNGTGFARNNYAARLAAAFARYQDVKPSLDVRAAQAALFFLGFNPGRIDGVQGPSTRAAVVAFQRKRRLPLTGRLDRWMIEKLWVAAFGF